MTFLLEAALRSSVPIVLGLLACVLLRHRSAALRHGVLTSALGAAIAVVPLSTILPSWNVPLPDAVAPVASTHTDVGTPARMSAAPAAVTAPVKVPEPSTVPQSSVGDLPDAMQILFVVWIAGVVMGGGRLLLGVVRLVRLTRRAAPIADGSWRRHAAEIAARYRISRPVDILATGASDVLGTWGVFRPRVLLPAHGQTWSEDRARVSLCHELAHVKRYDWPIQMTADAFRTVFWFNPLVWILCRWLRRDSELACDDAVLGAGVPGGTYASHLLDIARACRRPASLWVPVMSVARPSTLEGRITAMLDTRLNRQAPTWGAIALVLASLIGIVLPAASLDIAAQGLGPGALTGFVYDSTGGALPGVEVTLVDAAKAQRSAVSDGTGRFQFANVSGGKYVLEATLGGFRTLRSEFVLETPRDWTRNITLQVGELEETIKVTAKRPSQPAPLPRDANRSNPIRVGGSIKQPTRLKHVSPVYPAAMQAAGLEGIVPMDAVIGADGRVVSVSMLGADVHPEFARAAEEAVRQWVFTPTLLNNRAVDVEMTVSVRFSLED